MTERDRTRRRWGAEVKVGFARLWARAKQIATTDPTGSEDELVAARAGDRELAKQAGVMKGGMAKVAQLMAYGGAADELTALWDSAPPVASEIVEGVVARELGAPVAERFAAWDPVPIAAASLGQVHAARDQGGRALAVKVQYPGVADALASDLSSDSFTRRLAGAEFGQVLSTPAIEVLRRAIGGELDYRAEAAALERVRAAWRGDPVIRIPEVIASLSTHRVLTMTRAVGVPLPAVASGPATLRAEVATAIMRFAWGTPLIHGFFNADPNPGNYVIDASDDAVRVWFLDFGCTVELDAAVAAADRGLWHGVLDPDRVAGAERFRMSLAGLGVLREVHSMGSNVHRDWERALAAPFFADAGFVWDLDYHAELSRATRRVLAAGGLTIPPSVMLLWRARLGVSAVIAMLAPRVRFGHVLRDLLGTGKKALR